MRLTLHRELPLPADTAWQLITESDTLLFVTKGMMGFRALQGDLPRCWAQGDIVRLRILLFGVVPAWRHTIAFKSVSSADRTAVTEESGGVIRSWQHSLKVEALSHARCRYTDTVDIEAGLLTPLVYGYANLLFHYRQWRWAKLARLHRQ